MLETELARESRWSADSVPTGIIESDETILRRAVGFAVLAPSTHNAQPWRFRIHGTCLDVFADFSRRLPVADPENRELFISCGAALYNARLALRCAGQKNIAALFPLADQPNLVAHVTPKGGHAVTAVEKSLCSAISQRHSSRMRFYPAPLPTEFAAALRQIAASFGMTIRLIEGEPSRGAVADLVAEADRIQGSNPSFRAELTSWLHANDTKARDGMPGFAFGMPDSLARLAPMVLRAMPWGRMRAQSDRDLAVQAPLLAVLATETDEREEWVRAGEALQCMLLCATSERISAGFLNQPIEIAALRGRLREALRLTGQPQLLLRFGFGPPSRATPRREASELTF